MSHIDHLGCRRIRERDIVFDSHMSGFVYKVTVGGQVMIKKEIPSPDTVDEFMYEVNALSHLGYSNNVIQFYGIVVDDHDEHIKGLLISYAEKGALIDIIYEHCKERDADIPWKTREKWARQIVEGLSDIHESGFVQGDFTLSNIVIDEHGDAKIIDINRRGCPVGWEPPEATPLIERNQRISMYIGVKSDLYQLGMVLWALAAQEDEPETQGRPLILGPEVNIPDWYRRVAEICLSDEPRMRLQASSLLQRFPPSADMHEPEHFNPPPPSSTDDGYLLQKYLVDGYHPEGYPEIRTVEQPSDWSYVSRPYTDASPGYEPYYYTRGRSPPSPLTSTSGRYDSVAAWAANRDIPSSYSDVDVNEVYPEETPIAERPDLIEPDLIKAVQDLAVTEKEHAPIGDLEKNSATEVPMPLDTTNPREVSGERPESHAGQDTKRLSEEHIEEGSRDRPDATDRDSQDTPTLRAGISANCEVSTAAERPALQQDEALGSDPNQVPGASEERATEERSSKLSALTELETKHELPQTPIEPQDKAAQQLIETTNSEQEDRPITAGITVPDPITPAKTDTTLKTVTPPSTCGAADDRTTRTEGGLLHDKQSLRQEDDAITHEVEPTNSFDSLNGIGAAHVTSHDDIMQKKELHDDDFTSAAPSTAEGSPMITTTDAKT